VKLELIAPKEKIDDQARKGRKMNRLAVPLFVMILFVAVVGGAWTGVITDYPQLVLLYIGINIMMTVSLNLINGYMGEFSCGHAGFMAVGAYVSSVLTVLLFVQDDVFGAPYLPAWSSLFLFPIILLIGGAAAALAGLLVAIPSFRTRGDYLAIVTLAVNYIVKSGIENLEIVGGPRGFMGMSHVINAMHDMFAAPWMLIWTFVGVIVTLTIVRNFVASTYGKGVVAIREDEIAAEIMSVNTRQVKVVAFMLSSGLAGVAGGLFAHILGYINPGTFTIMKSTESMVMIYLGGMGSLTGSCISAVVFTLLLEVLRPLQVWKWVVIPLILILTMLFRPEGIMGNKEIYDVIPQLKPFFRIKEREEVERYAPASN